MTKQTQGAKLAKRTREGSEYGTAKRTQETSKGLKKPIESETYAQSDRRTEITKRTQHSRSVTWLSEPEKVQNVKVPNEPKNHAEKTRN